MTYEDDTITSYLSRIGRAGGIKSRRQLTPEQARDMVRAREAKRKKTEVREPKKNPKESRPANAVDNSRPQCPQPLPIQSKPRSGTPQLIALRQRKHRNLVRLLKKHR